MEEKEKETLKLEKKAVEDFKDKVELVKKFKPKEAFTEDKEEGVWTISP